MKKEKYKKNLSKKTENLIERYKQEEINSMNFIFSKDKNNDCFNEIELKFASYIDLSNKNVIKWGKLIWDNRNNEENLNEIINALDERRCPRCI